MLSVSFLSKIQLPFSHPPGSKFPEWHHCESGGMEGSAAPVSALADRDGQTWVSWWMTQTCGSGAGFTGGKAEHQPVTKAESCVPRITFFSPPGGHRARDRARSPINSVHPVEREFCSHAIPHPSHTELRLACLACSLVRKVQALETMDVVGQPSMEARDLSTTGTTAFWQPQDRVDLPQHCIPISIPRFIPETTE